jgi:hypothetical protein
MVKRLSFIMLPLLVGGASQALAAARGETYTCHFGRYGKVVIDTRELGSSITVGGKRYPAQGGSYFYQTEDGKVAAFGPAMTLWSYADARVDPGLNGIDDHHCVRRANRR